MNLKTNLSSRSNYGNMRDTIKYIVIHYTGNDGDSDEGNGNYFKNHIVSASAHYFVDDDSVTQSVPDNYTAWSVGGKKYPSCASTGGGAFYGLCTNANSISVELCDNVKNGVSDFTEKTLENAAELVRLLMKEYGVPISNVIRHFDVVGKMCPKPLIDEQAWTSFKNSLMEDDMAEQIYNWTTACPEWSIPYVQKALDLGFIKGDENGNLALTDTKIWCLVVMMRMQGIMD